MGRYTNMVHSVRQLFGAGKLPLVFYVGLLPLVVVRCLLPFVVETNNFANRLRFHLQLTLELGKQPRQRSAAWSYRLLNQAEVLAVQQNSGFEQCDLVWTPALYKAESLSPAEQH